jgi:membrane dipeptidase
MSFEHIKRSKVPHFELVPEIGRVPGLVIDLNSEEEDRASQISREAVAIDFHSHPIVLPKNMEEYESYSRRGRYHTGYAGLKRAGLAACFDGIGSLAYISSTVGWQFEDMVYELGMRFSDFDHHRDEVIIGRFADDIRRAKNEGKIAIIPHLENIGAVGNRLDRVDVLYGLGFRCAGLTYNDSNFIGGGLTELKPSGLTRFGCDVIGRMNDLKMLIDLSHSAEKVILQALEISAYPCVLTHDCAYSIHQFARCKTDPTLKAIADKGGVIGIEAVPNVLSRNPEQSIEDFLKHMEHAISVAGIDHVAVGTDTVFGDHVALHKKIMHFIDVGNLLSGFPADYVKGIENPSEIPNITRALIKRGYPTGDILKLIGGNVLRVFEEVVG